MTRINIPILKAAAATVKAEAIIIAAPSQATLQKAFGFENVGVITSDQVTDVSTITGQPVFMALQFDPVTYLDDNGSKVSLSGLYMPLVLCEFHLVKYAKKSIPAGRRKRGRIIEATNPGAWEGKIHGAFLNGDNSFPHDALKLLAQYLACTEAVGVTHELFKDLGIEYIYIETGTEIKPRKGFQNMLFFEIPFSEDTTPAIQLNLDNQPSS